MPSLKIYIAVSLLLVILPLTEAGVIKNVFKGVFGGTNDEKKDVDSDQRKPGQNENYRTPGFLGGQNRPTGEYGAGGTYTKKPVVVDGTTEKYKNTSWYIENEDYLSPNGNEMKQKEKPGNQYGAAGTYTVRPMGGTTERHSGNGNFHGNQQQRPSNNYNNQNKRENHNQRPINDGSMRGRETTRSSNPLQNSTGTKSGGNDKDSVVLQANDVTCTYSKLKEQIEKRTLTCNEKDCVTDEVYEKSSLWVCGGIKCTIANVDFSKDHGNKNLMECFIGRHIIDAPLRCKPDEKEVTGKCRKIF